MRRLILAALTVAGIAAVGVVFEARREQWQRDAIDGRHA